MRLTLGVALTNGLTLVPVLLAGTDGDLDLGVTVLEVQLQRDDRLARAVSLPRQLGDLAFVEKQLALAHDVVVAPGSEGVLGDVEVVHPHLAPVIDLGESIGQGSLAGAQGLHFSAL